MLFWLTVFSENVKKMHRYQPYAAALRHNNLVNKLSCLVTPRTPPYKIYSGEGGFYLSHRCTVRPLRIN